MLRDLDFQAPNNNLQPYIELERQIRPNEMPGGETLNTVMHPSVFKLLFGIFLVMMSTYVVTFWGSAHATFMVTISAGYMLIYFVLPIWMLKKQAQPELSTTSFAEFLRTPFETNTGKISGLEAAIQVCLIPACATIGVIGMCLNYAF